MANTRSFRTNLSCAGLVTAGTLSITGAAQFPGGITGGIVVTGNSTFNDDLHVVGDVQVDGAINFSGGQVFSDSTFQVQNDPDTTIFFAVDLNGATTGFGTTFFFSQTASRSINVPDANTDLLGHNTVQTVTNKSIDATVNIITNIADTNIAAGAAITLSKLAALGNNFALQSDGSGVISASTVTSTELALLSGLTGTIATTTNAIALTNKTIDADLNTISNIADANIKAGAAIARAKLAAGSANHVIINNGAGALSSEAQLANSRGGTGQDFSASTGLIKVAAGTFSAATLVNADVNAAAAIARSKLASGSANHVLINDGSGVMSSEASLAETRGGTAQSTYATGDILYASAANTLSKLAIDSAGAILKNSNSGIPAWEPRIDPSREVILYEDWLTDGTGQLRWLGTPVGAGATNSTGTAVASAGHPGILELATGTTTTGQSARYLGGVATGAAIAGFTVGAGTWTQEWLVRVEDLSDGTDRYNFDMGMYDAETLAVNSIRFRYSDNLNAGNWTAETISASTTTATDSGVAVAADTWYKLRIDVNAAGTSVTFYVNGVLVATHSTNIPSVLVAPRARMIKSLGTNSRVGYVDYFKFYERFSVAR